MRSIKCYSILLFYRVWFLDNNVCAACNHPDTFESVIDSYCTAEFGILLILFYDYYRYEFYQFHFLFSF